ncbi:hypothetical protein GE09DRAFT_1284026 [Coniochaeta sp. 2T2.1]|nr:hypothetical protein GE09DRAFT_1284026 [Coniochaeta sp. 2T2.1]
MQRCRAWFRLHGHTSKLPAPSNNNAGPAGYDREPPPYHDLGTTTGPATDLASITSAISIVAVVVHPPAFLSMNTTNVAKVISTMARAVATTPHALAYHRWGEPADGPGVSVTGTAEALTTGLDRDNALLSIRIKTMHSPPASARIIADNFAALALFIGSILGWVQPVACEPAAAAAITSALASVAKTVAAAPEESMAAIAELYASYADRAACRIVGGIIDAQSLLRDGRAPAASITTSPHSSFTETTTAEDGVKRLKKRKPPSTGCKGPVRDAQGSSSGV